MSAFDGIDTASTTKERRGPVASSEFRRILQLPRRVWDSADDLEALRVGLTEMLKTPDGTWELLPTQAAALREVHDFGGGLFGPICVGGGKALITLLAPVVLGASRPLLLLPAALRDQTNNYVIPEMHKQWELHPNLKVFGYEELSLEQNAGFLNDYQPDMIIADECHYLKRLQSGRTRRVSRYMKANPHTYFIALSGTIAHHSILDYWHIIQWALKPRNTPLPTSYYEVQEWARALDERVREEERLGPGVLIHLCQPDENPRQGYRRRLIETPGVTATGEDKLGVSLQLLGRARLKLPKELSRLLRQVEESWENPDGDPIMEAVQLWQIKRSLVCGFFRQWVEKPPEDWLEARKAWGHHVQHVLQYNRRNLDTPLQVWNDAKRAGNVAEFEAWNEIKDSFRPRKQDVWYSDYLTQEAVSWLRKHEGLCWVEFPALGRKISEVSGSPYFGAGDSHILEAKGAAVASIAAHGTGKNLQQWDRCLVLTPPTSGDAWEQMLGRLHRKGQKSDTVVAEVMVHHQVFLTAMQQAFADARFLQDSLGNQQRLLYCDTDLWRC